MTKWSRFQFDSPAILEISDVTNPRVKQPALAIELDFHIWSANWPMKCEAKMAAQGGQFCRGEAILHAVDVVTSHRQFVLKVFVIYILNLVMDERANG